MLRLACLFLVLATPLFAETYRVAPEQKARMDHLARALIKKPYPKDGAWLFIGQALSFYWLGQNARGDEQMRLLVQDFQAPKKGDTGDGGRHWQVYQVARLVELFGRRGRLQPRGIDPAVEKDIDEELWKWTAACTDRTQTDPAHDWWIWASENHHLQMWGSLWSVVNLLAADPAFANRQDPQGQTVAQLKKNFDDYFKRWLRARGTTGLLVEVNSPTYSKYSLGIIANLFDFGDPELQRLARAFLDTYWAQWSLEQIDGLRAGSRHRSYAGSSSITGDGAGSLAWYVLGVGAPAESSHPGVWTTASTSYTPAPLIQHIARDRAKLGTYQVTTRLPGLLDPATLGQKVAYGTNAALANPPGGVYLLDPQCGSLLRRTYMTPAFGLGCTMAPASLGAYSAICSQNRWSGALFAGGDTPRLFVASVPGPNSDSQWAVQDQGVMLVQSLLAKSSGTLRVWFSTSLATVEKSGWVFAEAPAAYAAVKVLSGASWQDDQPQWWHDGGFRSGLGRWLVPGDPNSLIVIEIAPKSAYANYDAFQKEILANPLATSPTTVTYQSTHYRNTLTMDPTRAHPPQINHQPVDYNPPFAYASPYLNGPFAGPQVGLKAFTQSATFTFAGH